MGRLRRDAMSERLLTTEKVVAGDSPGTGVLIRNGMIAAIDNAENLRRPGLALRIDSQAAS